MKTLYVQRSKTGQGLDLIETSEIRLGRRKFYEADGLIKKRVHVRGQWAATMIFVGEYKPIIGFLPRPGWRIVVED